ncbi:hypothetical protein [Pseudonocardia endophytica]|uniref:hypothetical protein n=1 Tax=Pseudonocardia endophytica TaxID=401976 RepID=UPI0014049C2F|nr:hypothetical protein [Pseudonocardia endophytica]
MRELADWWDAVELWVTQLAFGFQVVLVILVVIPVCALIAAGLDRLTSRFDSPADRR